MTALQNSAHSELSFNSPTPPPPIKAAPTPSSTATATSAAVVSRAISGQFYLLLNLSGDSNASGSPLLSRLDENIPAPDDLMNIGLANDLVRRDDPPPTAYLSDTGKNPPRRRKNGDFMPL
ncbi:hypothetical protein HYC85_009612 [Camellia sinensis]|uniref:Uncharacterized protein n=1 Tax=Camellia sinensis TaxID=4442 RepID=A0A7J7HI53_CAMSI|nr:hypothetical protein HYC85_009612 [Camellia sinensis]